MATSSPSKVPAKKAVVAINTQSITVTDAESKVRYPCTWRIPIDVHMLIHGACRRSSYSTPLAGWCANHKNIAATTQHLDTTIIAEFPSARSIRQIIFFSSTSCASRTAKYMSATCFNARPLSRLARYTTYYIAALSHSLACRAMT